MDNREKMIYLLCGIAVSLVVITFLYLFITPSGIAARNSWFNTMEKAEENSSYENVKKVEEKCRLYISSYKQDKELYEGYKNSSDETKREKAEACRIRANQTAINRQTT